MSLSLAKKFRPGIFGKFLILMIITGLIISSTLGLYWRNVAQPQFRGDYHNHIVFYQTLIAKDLGDPPDQKKAEAIAGKLRIGIRYESSADAEESWQTELFPQSFEKTALNRVRRGQFLNAIPTPTGRLLVYMRIRSEIETVHALGMVAIVAFVLFLAWLASRHLLRPIRELRAGMSAIEEGRLDLRLSIQGNDELADLKRNFNNMTQNLETMLRDRDRLLADVSHELRSPLTRMKVALEFNSDKKTAKTLRGEIMEMQAIIAALLDTERMAADANSENVRLDSLIADLCREYKIRLIADEVPATVAGSREKLKIAIRNIIENAKKHGAKPITVSCEIGDGFATVRVADSGAGIPRADGEKVFLPFYRAAGAAKRGYGLGLYMAKKMVESMHGTIGIVSAHQGAVIEIRLPLSANLPRQI